MNTSARVSSEQVEDNRSPQDRSLHAAKMGGRRGHLIGLWLDWTQNEFRAYNITVQLQDAAIFFGVDPLPQPAVAQEVLTTLDVDDMILNDNYKFLHCMVLAMNPVPTEESAVDDLAVHLLKLLGYLQAIAAFQMNNFRRERLLGQAPTGSHRKFPVTTELAEAVAHSASTQRPPSDGASPGSPME
ncbi:hypothetical protein HHX47_DHR5001063 [Lentinula edodes]|nr:hypothetical protein HHX47_DHR5001063 [Lentinula edodes]